MLKSAVSNPIASYMSVVTQLTNIVFRTSATKLFLMGRSKKRKTQQTPKSLISNWFAIKLTLLKIRRPKKQTASSACTVQRIAQ